MKTKQALQTFGSVIVLLIFFSSFLQVDTGNVVIIESLPSKYAEYDTNYHSLPGLHKYGWSYSIHVAHYADRSDTLILGPGTETLVLHNVLSFERWMKVSDSWMWELIRKNGYYEGWTPVERGAPNDTERVPRLRDIGEFIGVEYFVTTQPAMRRHTDSKDYFSAMKFVSSLADRTIETMLGAYTNTRTVFETRGGISKLRPLLAHAAYVAYGGMGYPETLYALQEAQSLALYCDNWIIDGKNTNVPRERLVIAAAQFRDIAEQLIDSMILSAERKEVFRKQFARSNRLSYEGQEFELAKLTLEHIAEHDMDSYEELYTELLYRCRCSALNAPYAFSLWSGGFLAGAPERDLGVLWAIGLSLGTGLQAINDLKDILPNEPGRFTDAERGRMTLPYYLAVKLPGTLEEHVPDIQRSVRKKVLQYHREARGLATGIPDNEGKSLIMRALDVLVTSKYLKHA